MVGSNRGKYQNKTKKIKKSRAKNSKIDESKIEYQNRRKIKDKMIKIRQSHRVSRMLEECAGQIFDVIQRWGRRGFLWVGGARSLRRRVGL